MPENVYEKLRELLDTHPVGCAPAPEMIEILKILFTEEEAGLALGLGFTPFSVDEIAHRTGVAPEQGHEKKYGSYPYTIISRRSENERSVLTGGKNRIGDRWFDWYRGDDSRVGKDRGHILNNKY